MVKKNKRLLAYVQSEANSLTIVIKSILTEACPVHHCNILLLNPYTVLALTCMQSVQKLPSTVGSRDVQRSCYHLWKTTKRLHSQVLICE